jgi:hypothetical protein
MNSAAERQTITADELHKPCVRIALEMTALAMRNKNK